MKRRLGIGALIVVAAMTAACGFDILEDIGSDPHPPTVTITAIVLYVEPVVIEETVETTGTTGTTETTVQLAATTTTPAALSTVGKTIAWNSGGVTLNYGDRFQIKRSYTDAGGDITRFVLRDRNNALNNVEFLPASSTYYSGTAGTVPAGPVLADGTMTVPLEIILFNGVNGIHNMEFWAEDSHGSRSEKVEFVINFVI